MNVCLSWLTPILRREFRGECFKLMSCIVDSNLANAIYLKSLRVVFWQANDFCSMRKKDIAYISILF